MAVFVNTANRAIRPRLESSLSPAARRARDQVFLDLQRPVSDTVQARKPQETSLYEAFQAVWEQFEGDDQQKAVCVRILAFHFLMEKTRGSVVEEWLRPSPESPETVVLDDAVVAAVGSAVLDCDGSLHQEELLSAVRAHFQQRVQKSPTPSKIAEVRVREAAIERQSAKSGFEFRELAAQLFAYEEQVDGVYRSELAVAFQICEKLRCPLTAMIGREAFRAIVIRALALGTREAAGLAGIVVKADGTLEGTCDSATRAAQVLVAHLVSGPAVLKGETLVRNILKTIWRELSDRLEVPIHPLQADCTPTVFQGTD